MDTRAIDALSLAESDFHLNAPAYPGVAPAQAVAFENKRVHIKLNFASYWTGSTEVFLRTLAGEVDRTHAAKVASEAAAAAAAVAQVRSLLPQHVLRRHTRGLPCPSLAPFHCQGHA